MVRDTISGAFIYIMRQLLEQQVQKDFLPRLMGSINQKQKQNNNKKTIFLDFQLFCKTHSVATFETALIAVFRLRFFTIAL